MAFVCTVPAVPTVLTEDEKARVTRWDFAPGATTGWHEHGMDYVVVIMTDAIMAYETDGIVSSMEVKAGQSYIRPAGVKHDVQNAGDTHLTFIEVEIKR